METKKITFKEFTIVASYDETMSYLIVNILDDCGDPIETVEVTNDPNGFSDEEPFDFTLN